MKNVGSRPRFKPRTSRVRNISDSHLILMFDKHKRNNHSNYYMKYIQNVLLTGLLFEALWILPVYLIKCNESYHTSMWTAVHLTRLPRELKRNLQNYFMKCSDTYQTTLWNTLKLHRPPYEVQWNLPNTYEIKWNLPDYRIKYSWTYQTTVWSAGKLTRLSFEVQWNSPKRPLMQVVGWNLPTILAHKCSRTYQSGVQDIM